MESECQDLSWFVMARFFVGIDVVSVLFVFVRNEDLLATGWENMMVLDCVAF